MNNINTLNDLANSLRIYPNILKKIINQNFNVIDTENKKIENQINILKYEKKKKNGNGKRVIYSVLSDDLKNLLKILNTKFSDDFIPHEHIHGFVKGRGIKTNANMHLTKKYLLSIDIQDFFTHITPDMVRNNLQKLYPNNGLISEIVSIITIDNHLPQGYNTSPIIANLILSKMDKELNSLCIGDIIYTRYADDLYFSSNTFLPELNDIEDIINKHNFKINQDKVKVMKRGQKQFVSGLTIFDNKYARIPKRKKRQLRLEVHKIFQHGWGNHASHLLKKGGVNLNLISDEKREEEIHDKVDEIEIRIYGWISFLYSIEPKFAIQLSEKLSTLKSTTSNSK